MICSSNGRSPNRRFAASRTRDLDVPRTDRMNTGFGQTEPASEEWFYKLQDRERYVLAYDDRSAGGLTDQMQVSWALAELGEVIDDALEYLPPACSCSV